MDARNYFRKLSQENNSEDTNTAVQSIAKDVRRQEKSRALRQGVIGLALAAPGLTHASYEFFPREDPNDAALKTAPGKLLRDWGIIRDRHVAAAKHNKAHFDELFGSPIRNSLYGVGAVGLGLTADAILRYRGV